jgi:predicted enzyme related to lactoylglutathione lyase
VSGVLESVRLSRQTAGVNLKINAPDLVTVEVPVADVPKAAAFYVDVVGATFGSWVSSRLCVLKVRRIKLLVCDYGLSSLRAARSRKPPKAQLQVDDVRAHVERARRAGAEIVFGEGAQPLIRDPYGLLWALSSTQSATRV